MQSDAVLPLTDQCLAVEHGVRCEIIPTAGEVLCLKHQQMRDEIKADFDIALIPLEEFRLPKDG